ncbi:hypothetical protein Q5Y75_19300 [Ruegeria sp. 2205SS24-7]|uniref:hypothetical protein n=1 Tax=Ruegeria discodermiae TaxID=3064389 RepID=UPI00274242A1|nr:hypothetical protein [Ruegeria sp. 2205SS24-7]MDP5219370.1 hypothetical protein [Ruegeria sp. 2205SS24-7]
MTQSLLETARANRLSALAHLKRTRQSKSRSEHILSFAERRAERMQPLVFTSCRSKPAETALAA